MQDELLQNRERGNMVPGARWDT